MKTKLFITLYILLIGMQKANCQLVSFIKPPAFSIYPNPISEPSEINEFAPIAPSPPTCSTAFISLQDPFRGFNTNTGQDVGFVNRYSEDNITATNICEYYSSIYPSSKSINDPNHNIGFENGNTDGWVRFEAKNYRWVPDYKCGQLTYWTKGSAGTRAEIINVNSDKEDDLAGSSLKMNPPINDNANKHFLKLGNTDFQQAANIIFRKIRIYKNNPILKYSYALVMGNFPHQYCAAPYFRAILLNKNCEIIECASQTVNVIKNGQNLLQTEKKNNLFLGEINNQYITPDYGKVLPWKSMVINTLPYFDPSSATYEDFTIVFITSACNGSMDLSYAYLDLEVGVNPISTNMEKNCMRKELTFKGPTGNFDGESYSWNFGDGTSLATGKNPKHTFMSAGTYNVNLTITLTHPTIIDDDLPAPLCCSTFTYTSPIQVIACDGYSSVCTDCINTFRPQIGKYYILSAWVKQDKAEINSVTNKLSYDKATVNLEFKNSTGAIVGTALSFAPRGEIIDGWQRIEEKFIIPEGAVSVDISLKNITTVSGNDAYYDDIRVFPFDGSLKSYVYDPNSQKLVAELDENNFATIYEYDESGVLVRVKKETERGIVTIKENGSNKPKRN